MGVVLSFPAKVQK